MEVVERLLLDRIDGQCTGLGIDFADEHAAMIATTATDACLPVGNAAVVRTEQALHPSIVQLAIIPTFETIHFSLFTKI